MLTEAFTVIPRLATSRLNYGVVTIGLHRIHAIMSTSNLSSIKIVERLGFRREGILRQFTPREGVWDDTVMLARLSSDEQAKR